ncbi:MAG: ABC transporter ATP-binding protein [Parachlamydiales bacterium]|nr:ABC transporter ATP-binding protein [Verrucomicrobiota bacterium]MBX3719381.1 ABC transporter ATP-binding protein [Candidatus Acheromyda pituitae]
MPKKNKKSALYSIQNVNFTYQLGSQKVQALQSLSLEIPNHSLITFSGPSGSGKSTLLNLMGLIEPVQDGEILFQNEKFSEMSKKRKNEIRKFKIGFIFQQFHLVPVLTAEENVEYFLKRQKLSHDEVQKRTRDSLEAVGLWKHRNKKPSELSGGQKQRVAIARAIAKRPEVIIGDEPTASLDQQTGKEIMSIFTEMIEKQNVTIILTTHDPMIKSYSHLDFHIQDGQLLKSRHS